jgi:hypothetical protein
LYLHEKLKVDIATLRSGTLDLLVATTGLQIDTLYAKNTRKCSHDLPRKQKIEKKRGYETTKMRVSEVGSNLKQRFPHKHPK